MKIAFVDRDGTINIDYEDDEWRDIDKPILIHGSLEGLKEIRKKGYEIIIITNQYMINDGIITLKQYNEFTNKLLEILNSSGINILDIFYCPHSLNENCNCRKPKTGLVDMALKKYPQIDLNKSFFVGDSLCDIELGNGLGIRTFGINVKSQVFNYIELKSLHNIIKYL
jgi:D-glycero-D-manno-heptose 1,7-bisphosphate phosphatase